MAIKVNGVTAIDNSRNFYGNGSNLTGVGGSTTAGAVGTYLWGTTVNSSTARPQFIFGSTYAGSGIYPAGFGASSALIVGSYVMYSSNLGMKDSLVAARSGTWRCMGQSPQGETDEMPSTLFVRIS